MTQTLLQVLQKQPFVEVFRPEHTQKLATLASWCISIPTR